MVPLALAGCRAKPVPGTVVVDIESSPNNLDLRIGTDAQSEHVGALIFESLVKKDEHYNLQPWLATSWQWRDPRTLVFQIRPNVRFHDGSPLTAADVAWTIESMHTGAILTSKSSNFSSVDRAEATGLLTCVVHLKKSDVGVLFNLSDGLSGIVKRGAGNKAPLIGTGPFRFVSQVVDKEILLDRNPYYWGKQPHIDHVRFNVVPDDTTRALEIRKGSADIVSNALRLDTVYYLRNDPRVVIETYPGSILNYINFNVTDPELHDRRVRQAIAYAVDRAAIIRAVFRGEARLANTMLPEGHWAAATDAEIPQYNYNPAKARALLDEAGLKPDTDGIRLHLTLKTSTDDTTRLIAMVVQQQLRQVGIALELRSNEFGTFYADVTKGAFQMYALRWLGANEDPDIFRYQYSSSSFPPKGANRGHFSNPRVDALLMQGQSETDQAKRRIIYVELERILAEEEPTLNLFYLNNVVVHSHRLKNVRPNSSANFDFLVNAEFTQ
ncbi:MAG: ABC transporter substrate-binding protein [Acidobacteria bacterium]|nr:ABC transporter substrate-binding protein [Acidobacteriota bacterium]